MQNLVAIVFVLAVMAMGTELVLHSRPQPKPVSVGHCVIPLGGCKPPNKLHTAVEIRDV